MRFSMKFIAFAFLLLSSTAAFAQTADRHPLFDRMDANKDGYLTKDEVQKQFPKFTDEMFQQADTNHDGKLTVAEWQAFARAKRAERKGGLM
ncbi:EF-hand domain-containing protein [Fundidesulfovibrio agrisoli]|uniref:EF-hand domain-containing protein n=1 Tax=Fundidesulfovibrio agrisoli TaxID=2922717 RepID=UPI001FADE892|nr:EF-hand domain-containing protein [Fundidesulfovibrio agrisoli]